MLFRKNNSQVSGIRILLFCLVLIAFLSPFNSRSQQVDSGDLQVFTQSSFYQGLLSNVFAQMPPALFQRCPTLVSNGSKVTILQSVTFGADSFPNSGLWKQSFPVSGCGNDTTLNLYFSANKIEKINTIVGIPGGTLADLTLQQNAITYAEVVARTKLSGCTSIIPINSMFVGYGLLNPATPDPGPVSFRRPWREEWTLAGCDHKISEIVEFVPDQTGTTIVVPLSDAIEQP